MADTPLGEEHELWRGRPSQWNNLGWWLLGLLVIPLPWTIFRALKLATTNFTLTNQRLRIQTGILTRETEEVEMYRVRDTAIRQSLFERMFGLGTLIITSSDERTPEVLMKGIPGPHDVREHFRNQTEAMRRKRGVRDIDIS